MDFTSRVDPELAPGLEIMAALSMPEDRGAVAATRESFAAILAAAAPEPDETVARADHQVPGRDGVSVRVYRPHADGALPTIFWIHGGGMIVGSVAGDDAYCERLVRDLGCAVVSVEYRLAPENPFPVPLEDCYAGLCFTAENAVELGVDASKIVLGGASAGGGLAAGTALMARDKGGPALLFQYLMYPMIDDRNATPSSQEFGGIASWSTEHNINGWDCYLGERDGDVSSYAAPSRATDLSGLPPTLIQVGELEVFRDEDIDYATRLLQAGVSTELHVYPGAYHGWDIFNPEAAVTKTAIADRNRALQRVLNP